MAGRLAGKHAIVTGAGQGIGAAIARCFAAAGARVVVAERNAATGAAVAEEIGGRFIETDVTDAEGVAAMAAEARAAYGAPDILVNNAGINVFHDPLDTTDAEWRRCLSVDLEGPPPPSPPRSRGAPSPRPRPPERMMLFATTSVE